MRNEHLEVAIGTGTLLQLILYWRFFKRLPKVNITGFDYAERMLNGAKRKFTGYPNVKLIRADAAHLDFPDRIFDTANIANAIHCFPDVNGSLKEIFRVLKPGGTIAVNILLSSRGTGLRYELAECLNRWGKKKGILEATYEKDDILQRIQAVGFVIKDEFISGNSYFLFIQRPEQ